MTLCPVCQSPTLRAEDDHYCPVCAAHDREPLVSRMGPGQTPPVVAEGAVRGAQSPVAATTETDYQSISLELPLPPRRCQANGPHCHWAVKAKARKQYRQEAFYIAREAELLSLGGPVVISVEAFTARRPRDGRYRPMDADGLIGAMKGAVDGLRDAHVLVDDTADLLSWGEVVIHGAKESAGRASIFVTLTKREKP